MHEEPGTLIVHSQICYRPVRRDQLPDLRREAERLRHSVYLIENDRGDEWVLARFPSMRRSA